jgi:hypothetical protein
MMKPGAWWISSKSDPRWNVSGRSKLVDGVWGCVEMDKALKKLEKKYGEYPEDLVQGCMKD